MPGTVARGRSRGVDPKGPDGGCLAEHEPAATVLVSNRLRYVALGLIPAIVAFLRALPYLRATSLSTATGETILRVGYLPQDFLSYIAFIRQTAEQGHFLLHDPFTTDPHDPRFILVFHWALGSVVRWTGADPTLVLELSRVPLTFLFFAVLWWFLKPILEDPKQRFWACLLVGLSGGIEGLLKPLTFLLSPFVSTRFTEATWHMYGWNTFQSLYNPLWIAGLTLALVVLRPVLQSGGLRGWRDVALVGLGFPLLYFVHPYSALVVAAVVVAVPIVQWILRQSVATRAHVSVAAALAPGLALVAAIGYWQSLDPVYRASAGNVFGTLSLAVFWYPLTLGAVGVFALRGSQTWARQAHPYRLALWSWIGAVVFLHTSPVINGYHFLFHLHLPLCICAAPAVAGLVERARASRSHRRTAFFWMLALFVNGPLVTAESIGDIARRNVRSDSYRAIIDKLATLPPGNVFAPPELGNVLPAYTEHRVWVGHWFLTPSFHTKSATYDRLASDEHATQQLIELMDREAIRYVVVPATRRESLARRLGERIVGGSNHAELVLLTVDPACSAGR